MWFQLYTQLFSFFFFSLERVFEESEIVADCILAWPVKSQNMIFFETREDHFGFIESPKVRHRAFLKINTFLFIKTNLK